MTYDAEESHLQGRRWSGTRAVAALFASGPPDRYLPTIRSVLSNKGLQVVVGSPQPAATESFEGSDARVIVCESAVHLVNRLWRDLRSDVLVINDAVVLPDGFADRALKILDADPRIATVSFLCNDAGFLTFPTPPGPAEGRSGDQDASDLTRRLRELPPEPGLAPIPTATGPAVLLSATALGIEAPLTESLYESCDAALIEYCQRCRRRGFLDVVDTGTFVARLSGRSPATEAVPLDGLSRADAHRIHVRYPELAQFARQEAAGPNSAVALAVSCARAKVTGLRVLIDGSCLREPEMGTQVATLGLIRALAGSNEVERVGVSLLEPPPPRAQPALTAAKVDARVCPDLDLTAFGRMDIGHRPYQPAGAYDLSRWQLVADRVVVSMLDLLAYRTPSYHHDLDDWLSYRQLVHHVFHRVDGVSVISRDVRTQMELDRLPIDTARVFEIPLGTDHMTGDECVRAPQSLAGAGLETSPFLLCIGANYTHKNRDLAVKTYRRLRERGWQLSMVLAGLAVPAGSSQAADSSLAGVEGVHVVSDLPSAERNWLLQRAALVLYPTSGEGFGLVPFEAARWGTATVHVSFGPLAQSLAAVPVTAGDWSPDEMADAAEALLTDPALREAQIRAVLDAGTAYTWRRTADELTAAYRQLLAWPPRR